MANRAIPVQVKNLTNVQAISAGYEYALALKTNGELWGWGGNYFGHAAGRPSSNTDLVDPNEAVTADRKSILNPVLVTSNILNFAAGEASTFAYRSDGISFSWGYNDASDGRLGTGNGNGSPTPVVISGLSNVKSFATGLGHTYALKTDGIIWAWGNRGNCSAYPNCTLSQGTGYFADGSTSNATAFSPVQIGTISDVVSMASGWYHTLAIKSNGTVWAWGLNGEKGGSYDGRSGSGNLSPFIYSPEQVIIPGGASISQVDGGTNFSLAVSSSGEVYAWGADSFGQLGTGRSLTRPTAPTSSNLTGFKLP
jgi:alpha-tubulin suppressor-like RCC1 family protein